MIVDETEPLLGRGEFGKVPDFISRQLKYTPGIGGKIRGGIQLGKILFKSGAYKRVARYYGFKYRYRIGAGIATASISSFLTTPNQFGQTRGIVVQSRSKRFRKTDYKSGNRHTAFCCQHSI